MTNRRTPQTLNRIWGVLLTKEEGAVAQNRTLYFITYRSQQPHITPPVVGEIVLIDFQIIYTNFQII